ncbi:proton channel OTOP3 isoform X2 [Hyperolius riggenbachi]
MLTLATNVLLWLLAVINDSVHRELESLQVNTTTDKSIQCLCTQHSICLAFQRGYVTLYPFNLEYSLISASMLFIMWRNVGRNEVSHFAFSQPTLRLQGVLYGPVLGVATLLVGICIFIQYQIQASTGTAAPTSFIMYYVYSVVLLSIMVITCIIGVIAQTFRDKHLAGHSEINSDNSENQGEIGRASKQEYKKHCRQREEERGKGSEQQTSNTVEHRVERREYNNNRIDQEDNGEHRRCPQENSHKCIGQTETEKHNESSPKGELVKDDIKDHMDTSHDYSTLKRKFTDEKADHSDFETSSGKRTPKNHIRSLEIILLLTAALGQFSISYYSIVALVATRVWSLLNSLNLSHSILMILQHISQSVFIVEGMRKEHQEQIQQKLHQESKDESPRRMSMLEIRRASLAYLQNVGKLTVSRRLVKEIALFLVLCNIMSWIMSAFGAHPQYTNGLERAFYGSSAWFSILNFGLPLSVFYRMHSVGGLLDVYLTA